jgi:hypothetical protein
MQKKKQFFWRGVKSEKNLKRPFIVKKVHKYRTPTDTPEEIQKWIDDEFEKKFGWRPRSQGVFASASVFGAYNPRFIFFPIGKYKYIWSPEVQDFFGKLDDIYDIGSLKFLVKGLHQDAKEPIKNTIKDCVKTYSEKPLSVTTKNELIFNIQSKNIL